MRLALLHYTAPPIAGGVERIVGEQATEFARRGHEVSIFAGAGKGGETAEGGRVIILPWLRQPAPEDDRSPDQTERLAAELEQLLAAFDVVFLHNVLTMPFHLPLTAALWRLADRIPDAGPTLVGWIHDVAAAHREYAAAITSSPLGELLARAHPRIRYVAVSGERRREFCRVSGASPDACTVAPNGFDALGRLPLTPLIRAYAERHSILERGIILLHPARLVRRKNLEWSLQITTALREIGSDAVLLLTAVADPHQPSGEEYRRELLELAERLGISERVHWVSAEIGPLNAQDVDSLYALADALLFPSRHEGFGLPLLEAAVHRVPIFCSDLALFASMGAAGSGSSRTPEDSPSGIPLTTFALDTPPAVVAREIHCKLHESSPFQQRKAGIHGHGWSAVYRDFLAPLLESLQPPAGRP